MACDSADPDLPQGPGTIQVVLVSPVGNEGSGVFEVRGGAGLGVVSAPGGEVLYQHFQDRTRLVVVMADPGEIRFRIPTTEVSQVPSVEILQVADGNNDLRGSLEGYSARVSVLEGPATSLPGAVP